ncbi:type II toxin-antitoxin system VapC family toxin [Candidatus Uhrbacteria bacterium]|nr:type II toxin-antitoxin system VapC family toxin [Candidatus Uhrbacteria bacterium]
MAYLVDSSIFVALFLDFDANHQDAVHLMEVLNGTLYITSGAVGEVATVLTYKHSKEQADLFLEYLVQSDHMTMLGEWLDDEITFFASLPQRISFVDSTLLMRAQRMNLSVVTFDRQLKQIAKKMNIPVV